MTRAGSRRFRLLKTTGVLALTGNRYGEYRKYLITYKSFCQNDRTQIVGFSQICRAKLRQTDRASIIELWIKYLEAHIPDRIKVIRDVTEDDAYKNYNLAKI